MPSGLLRSVLVLFVVVCCAAQAVANTGIIVLSARDPLPSGARPLRTIEISHRETYTRTLRQLIDEVKASANAAGANIIQVLNGDAVDRTGHVKNIRLALYTANDIISYEREITWDAGRRLQWSDFKGAVPRNAPQNVAAITACGIGYETNTLNGSNQLCVTVYNVFYTGESWVRPGEDNAGVLRHEQGHFDLCELYTRKLRDRFLGSGANAKNMHVVLRKVYNQVQAEYLAAQEQYEAETAHGLNEPGQDRWVARLNRELGL